MGAKKGYTDNIWGQSSQTTERLWIRYLQSIYMKVWSSYWTNYIDQEFAGPCALMDEMLWTGCHKNVLVGPIGDLALHMCKDNNPNHSKLLIWIRNERVLITDRLRAMDINWIKPQIVVNQAWDDITTIFACKNSAAYFLLFNTGFSNIHRSETMLAHIFGAHWSRVFCLHQLTILSRHCYSACICAQGLRATNQWAISLQWWFKNDRLTHGDQEWWQRGWLPQREWTLWIPNLGGVTGQNDDCQWGAEVTSWWLMHQSSWFDATLHHPAQIILSCGLTTSDNVGRS